METKSLLVGGLLVIVGALLGFTISMVSAQDAPCRVSGKYGPGYAAHMSGNHVKGKPHRAKYDCAGDFKGHKSDRRGNRSFQACVYDLDLTDDQKQQIEKIFSDKDARREERRKEFRSERKRAYESVLDVLTDEQKKEYEKLREERYPCRRK
ncbi:MAG: hypothetical protein R6U95_02045 [Bacteroidales bacterium]